MRFAKRMNLVESESVYDSVSLLHWSVAGG